MSVSSSFVGNCKKKAFADSVNDATFRAEWFSPRALSRTPTDKVESRMLALWIHLSQGSSTRAGHCFCELMLKPRPSERLSRCTLSEVCSPLAPPSTPKAQVVAQHAQDSHFSSLQDVTATRLYKSAYTFDWLVARIVPMPSGSGCTQTLSNYPSNCPARLSSK